MNFQVYDSAWVDVYATIGAQQGSQLVIQNQGGAFNMFVVVSATTPINTTDYLTVEPGEWESVQPKQGMNIYVKMSTGSAMVFASTTSGRGPQRPYNELVASGNIGSDIRVAIYGNNPDVDTEDTPSYVWAGGPTYNWMTAMTYLEVVSSSSSDASAGVGARTVLITGLNDSYQIITASVVMTGTVPVAVGPQFYRINSAQILTAGTDKINVGDITIRDLGGGTIRGIMPAGIGNLSQCVYTVPDGYNLLVMSVLASINRVGAARWASLASLVILNGVSTVPAEASISSDATYVDHYDPPAAVPARADTAVRVMNVSGDNTNITAAIRGKLVKV